MCTIVTRDGELSSAEQEIVTAGFVRHTDAQSAPHFDKQRRCFLAYNEENTLIGVLTADVLWDWMYIDELWVDEATRGQGLGNKLMLRAEDEARSKHLAGVWLWTQSWQAESFYSRLGYREFTRFPNFPRGHYRVGLRKEF